MEQIKACPGHGDCKLRHICRLHDAYRAKLKVEELTFARQKLDKETNKYVCADFIMSEFYGN